MTIQQIKAANRAKGGYWFEPDTLRFFRSRVGATVYEGPGGVYFVSSEQFVGSQGAAPRCYTVRQFDPNTADIRTIGPFNTQSRTAAVSLAKRAAAGTA